MAPRRSIRNRQSEDEESSNAVAAAVAAEPRRGRGRRSSVTEESEVEETTSVPEPPAKKGRRDQSAVESDALPEETEAEAEAEAGAPLGEGTGPQEKTALPLETTTQSLDKATLETTTQPLDSSATNARKYTAQPATENPLPPNQTLFVTNLPTAHRFPTVRADVRRALYNFFGAYGAVLEVVAGKRPGLRGSAFVVFKEIRAAAEAMRQLQGFPFFERPLRIQFARTKSKAARDMDLVLRTTSGGQ
jgi:hypothetical protein